jgi:hypothetical protein
MVDLTIDEVEKIVEMLCKLKDQDFQKVVLSALNVKAGNLIGVVGMLETIKNNLLLNMMDKKAFILATKNEIDKENHL